MTTARKRGRPSLCADDHDQFDLFSCQHQKCTYANGAPYRAPVLTEDGREIADGRRRHAQLRHHQTAHPECSASCRTCKEVRNHPTDELSAAVDPPAKRPATSASIPSASTQAIMSVDEYDRKLGFQQRAFDMEVAELKKRHQIALEDERSRHAAQLRRVAPNAIAEVALGVLRNVVRFFSLLPAMVYLRYTLICILFMDMTPAEVGRSFSHFGGHLQRETIHRARTSPEGQSILSSIAQGDVSQSPNLLLSRITTNGERTSSETRGFAERVWRMVTRQSATRTIRLRGETLPVRWLAMTKKKAYMSYQREVVKNFFPFAAGEGKEWETLFKPLQRQGKAVGYNKFSSFRTRDIKKQKIHECTCPICRKGMGLFRGRTNLTLQIHVTGKSSIHSLHQITRNSREKCTLACSAIAGDCEHQVKYFSVDAHADARKTHRANIQAYNAHIDLCNAQDAQYRKDKELARTNPKVCTIQLDFTRYDTGYRRDPTQSENQTQLNCLHVIVFYGEGGELIYKAFDIFHDKAKNDYSFVRAALLWLMAQSFMQRFDLFKFWSDGGPKHFKIRRTLFFATVELANIVSGHVDWNFFPSYHGKGPCDGRAGTAKRLLVQAAREDEVICGAQALTEFFNKNMKHANAASIPIMPVGEGDLAVSAFLAIKKFHLFLSNGERNLDGSYTIQAWQRSDKSIASESFTVTPFYELKDDL